MDAQIDGYPIVDLPFEFAVKERRFEWTGRLTPNVEITKELSREDIQRAEAFRERTRRESGPEAAARRARPPVDPPGTPPPVVRSTTR